MNIQLQETRWRPHVSLLMQKSLEANFCVDVTYQLPIIYLCTVVQPFYAQIAKWSKSHYI